MARIMGGVGTSLVPTLGIAYDKGRTQEAAWAPLFQGCAPVAQWLAEHKPDALMVFNNDHATSFFFDVWPSFALSVRAELAPADEGAGLRPLPRIKGHPGLAIHLAEQLVRDEFDLTIVQDQPLDHGLQSALPLLWSHEPDWPGAVIPLQINVLSGHHHRDGRDPV